MIWLEWNVRCVSNKISWVGMGKARRMGRCKQLRLGVSLAIKHSWPVIHNHVPAYSCNGIICSVLIYIFHVSVCMLAILNSHNSWQEILSTSPHSVSQMFSFDQAERKYCYDEVNIDMFTWNTGAFNFLQHLVHLVHFVVSYFSSLSSYNIKPRQSWSL